jgi:DUF971 family protein
MTHTPSKIQLHKQSKMLELHFGAQIFHLSAEYLRVHSPSAEVKGHGPNQAVLQDGKQDVGITGIEIAGRYALKVIFDDGHDTGLYTWAYLYDLGTHYEHHWQTYLAALAAAGKSREKDICVVKFV